MAKAKRMSDIFASSAENSSSAPAAVAAPYSSEGPTLPIISNADSEHTANAKKPLNAPVLKSKMHEHTRNKKKAEEENSKRSVKDRAEAVPTFDPALYEAWNILPAELLRILISQERLRPKQNIVSIVFTKNQNTKAGINRLKKYLGAYVDKKQPMDIPDALKQSDAVIVVSAQGEGTLKLVSIVDMVRRVVAPNTRDKAIDGKVETWWMYTSLASVEVEHKTRANLESTDAAQSGANTDHTEEAGEEEEKDAFEPMEVDTPAPQQKTPQKQTRQEPVLTVWMTKKKIPAFKETFGEQTFEVQILPEDD